MIKFFTEKENIGKDKIYLKDKDDIRHLVKVLRAQEGDEIVVSDKISREYTTEVEGIYEDEVVLKIIESHDFTTEPSTKVTLFQGVPKAQKMELIIQKCVEMGICEIVPVFMERTVVVDNGKLDKKTERWQKISDEAVKQCKRGIIPEICAPIDYNGMIKELSEGGYDLILMPYENEDNRTIKNALRDFVDNRIVIDDRCEKNGAKVAIIIGPEGGFSEKEIKKATELNNPAAEIVTLGCTILRTETAGIAALSMVMYELEL